MWIFLGMVAALVSAYAALILHLMARLALNGINRGLFFDSWPVIYFLGGGVLLFFLLPYFMGLVAAIFWHRADMTEGYIDVWSLVVVGFWLLPSLMFTFGMSILLLPFLHPLFERGVRIGNSFWRRQAWKECFGWRVPEVEQRKRRRAD